MKNRYIFMKLLGLLMIIVGFSYTITSFYNFFEYIFGYKILVEDSNLFLMIIGLIFPVYLFVFGIYFYFYTDFNITKINKFLNINYLFFLLLSIAIVVIKKINLIEIFIFIHFTFAYCLFVLSIIGIYGCVKYKY